MKLLLTSKWKWVDFLLPLFFFLRDKQFSVSLANFFLRSVLSSVSILLIFALQGNHVGVVKIAKKSKLDWASTPFSRWQISTSCLLRACILRAAVKMCLTRGDGNKWDLSRGIWLWPINDVWKFQVFAPFQLGGDKSQVWNFLHFLLPHYTWLKLTTTKKLKFLLCCFRCELIVEQLFN